MFPKNLSRLKWINRSSIYNIAKYQFTQDKSNTFIHPDTGEEFVIDNKYDNILHGIFTRDDYEKSTGRSSSEIGRLGRLFIYQYNCCPYCGKVKSVLDYYKIPYSLIEVGPVTKKQLPNRARFLHDRNVPILLAAKTDGTRWNKSSSSYKVLYQSNVIIKSLLQHLTTMNKIELNDYNRSNCDVVNEWHNWFDNILIPHIYLLLDSNDEYLEELFLYLNEFEKFKQMAITSQPLSYVSTILFKNQCKQIRYKYGVQNGDELKSLYNIINEWHDVTKITFHGGIKPDLADLIGYGIFKTFKNISFFSKLLIDTNIKEWYDAVDQSVGENACVTHA